MSRRHGGSEVTYDDRRERDYVSRTGGRYEDSYVDQEVKFRRSAPPVREREREREEIDIRETRSRDTPAFLREDYGRTSAGPVVLRAREREDFDFIPRAAPEPERKSERESIIIRRDREESPARPPPRRERSRDREEIVIRRDREEEPARPPPRRERSRDREEIIIRERSRPAPPPPPPPPEEDIQREEIIIRREGRSQSRPAPIRERDDRDDRETIIIRRREEDDRASRYEPPPRGFERDREEIIIRRGREEEDRPPPRREIDFALVRPKSRERERSMARHDSDSEREIIIRRDKSETRGGREREREEIIIRHHSESRSPSPAPSIRSARSTRTTRTLPPPEPPVVYAPQIHQEVITHHRHIDHGYEVQIAQRPRPISRPPSPPTPPSPSPPPPPPPVRERSEERIEIRRSGERNGRPYDEDIVIDRNEGARSVPPPEPRYEAPPRRDVRWREEREVEEDYYSSRALSDRRPRNEGASYSSLEISREVSRPEPIPATGGDIGRRYGKTRDPKAGLWTEVTKDLVIKEAITEMGYEYEETDEFYYIIAYLKYDDVARLVGLSEDIRKDRRRRVKELEWESRIEPEPPRRPLAIEAPLPPRRPRSAWDREDERYIEREVIYRGGRPPPPPGWRRG